MKTSPWMGLKGGHMVNQTDIPERRDGAIQGWPVAGTPVPRATESGLSGFCPCVGHADTPSTKSLTYKRHNNLFHVPDMKSIGIK
jgi:hypothetical protein